ncbi:small redox-active disulfide protein 2 [Humidesulfovibrio mexicanus]|uniref:Small redox-active disulfide protein 2 n=1 Tax=Humidesulfovibrio mexicanus TaxID=147047 RepID=A0A239AS18_9BACT|nr:thioredoxin family protein [Humidesulfovibrio mexicanus]SNR98329.1 small redox-active disulfide protein 2 [Humidesulfovibrio mexicanus]
MEIKVLGPGCPKCHETEKLVREAVAEAGVQASVVKVSDFQEMAMLGVFATPAVVVEGEVKCSGRVPAKTEVLGWLGK